MRYLKCGMGVRVCIYERVAFRENMLITYFTYLSLFYLLKYDSDEQFFVFQMLDFM